MWKSVYKVGKNSNNRLFRRSETAFVFTGMWVDGTMFYPYNVELKLKAMLRWTIIFLVVAIIAAIFGFGGIAAGAAGIAKFIFFLFLVLFVISLFSGSLRRP